MHPTTQYALDVVEGRRVAGKLEIAACQRHLDDLARQGTDDFPWVFDETRADTIFLWFSYCCHVEGPLAGRPIELQPFQKFDLGCIFGWVHREGRYRRFEKAYEQMARKNAKSTIMSGIALYLMCGDHEVGPQVYCAAVDKGQARIVYRAAKAMAQKSPDIRKRLKIGIGEISHKTRGGCMMPLSKSTDNKDGFNPSGAIIDEYHAHATSEIYDLIWSAWGQRDQALMVIITTAGFETNQNPCYLEYEYCLTILNKAVRNERYFVMIRQMDEKDDEHDPANWIKCNPLRAATPEGLARLKQQHDEAFGSRNPVKIRNFRVKNLNKWVNEPEHSYLGEFINLWDQGNVGREKFAELTRGKPCIVGIDLSRKFDLTADAFVFDLGDLGDGVIGVSATGFMPEGTLDQHKRTDKVPYAEWAEDGWLIITDGNVTDYASIETHIHDQELEHGYTVKEIGYDPYNATHFANELMSEGYTCVEIRQGMKTLSEPTKLFREKLASGKLIHDGSPLLKWCAGNAVVEVDKNENIQLSKKNASSVKRIDLLAATINGVVRVEELPEEDLNDAILDDEWGMS